MSNKDTEADKKLTGGGGGGGGDGEVAVGAGGGGGFGDGSPGTARNATVAAGPLTPLANGVAVTVWNPDVRAQS